MKPTATLLSLAAPTRTMTIEPRFKCGHIKSPENSVLISKVVTTKKKGDRVYDYSYCKTCRNSRRKHHGRGAGACMTLRTLQRALKGEDERPVAAWLKDMKAHFEGATVTYLKGPGIERGEKGEEGVVAVQKPA